MKRRLFLLCGILFLDCQITGSLRESTSLEVLRNAGMPVEKFQEKGCSPREMRLYLDFWKDLQYFPVAGNRKGKAEVFSFADTWHEKRSYGGEHFHEGCDIFGACKESGYYPVVSMTDGVVEKIGWLPLGGWRIGVRSPGGGYFYYAHLSAYAKDFAKGDLVKAGEVLGLLGDTGYGEEGTTGKFLPHLHLGIYVQTDKEDEYALNPYPVLQFLRKKQKNFFY